MGNKYNLEREEAFDLFNIVKGKLERKYSIKFSIEEAYDNISGLASKNSKVISLIVTESPIYDGSFTFIIGYGDLTLQDLAEAERLELKADSIDDSGL